MALLSINERLRYIRKEFGYTQKELAEKIELTERQYCNIECGRSIPSLDTIIKIADIYNVSIDYIVERTDFRVIK